MKVNRLYYIVPILVFIVLIRCSQSSNGLQRTWQLITMDGTSAQNDTIFPYGLNPYGMLMYDETGHMSVLLMRQDRSLFASGDMRRGTDLEVRNAFESFGAYCGTYTIDEEKKTVIHHLQGAKFPNWIGSDQQRYYLISGDTLKLSAPPILVGGVKWNLKAKWIRISR
jgi:hypothetical protein